MVQHRTDSIKIKSQNGDTKQKMHSGGRREKRPPKRISKSYLHNSGLYYLERFSASKNHFITVMTRKVRRSCMYHEDQDFEECVTLVRELADRFEGSGLLNDDLYTDGLVNSLRRRGLSRQAIIHKMRHKGISAEKTVKALESLDETNYETQADAEKQAALKLAKKKKLGPYNIRDEVDIKKALGVFARAGFSYEVAKSVLDMTEDDIPFY